MPEKIETKTPKKKKTLSKDQLLIRKLKKDLREEKKKVKTLEQDCKGYLDAQKQNVLYIKQQEEEIMNYQAKNSDLTFKLKNAVDQVSKVFTALDLTLDSAKKAVSFTLTEKNPTTSKGE